MSRLPKQMFTCAIAFAAVALLPMAAQAQSPSARGHALLNDYCARCHAIGKTGKSPHEAAPAFRTLGRSFDLDDFAGRLQRGLMPGHPDMPAFKFERDDARAVAAYLRDIQE